jgi:hypothetical protein
MDRNTQIGVKLINKIKKPEGELKRGFASLDKKSSPSPLKERGTKGVR